MYSRRRKELLESLPDYSITLLYSSKAPYSIGDEQYPFKVDRNFFYYTGLDYEGLYLMLVKMGETSQEMIYIEPFDELQAKWVGGKVKAEEARLTSLVNDVRFIADLKLDIAKIINTYGVNNRFTLCTDLKKQYLEQKNEVLNLFNEIKLQQGDVEIKNINREISIMRMKKDDSEIDKMRHAINITKTAIETVMSYTRENVWEYELEAYFDYILKANKCDHAFDTIMASGKNATILHYRNNDQYIEKDSLVLIDCGASYQKYNADVTRTFPASGKFTERQKQIYDIVLRGNKYIASIARANVTTKWLNERLIEFYQHELKSIGLLENGKTVRDYYWHGVSHPIGLETHDCNLPDYPLVAGAVISDEPGLYLEDEGIGIRIEDDLLITEKGCEVLTKDIIKEIDEIEEFMASFE